MARRFTLELIMDLASRIGANPAKAISRSNISFLGKGPTKNPLFQNRLAGLENATEANLGKPETLFAAIDDAVGWAKDGKLNSIQTEILGHNLSGIERILHPPPLPMATVTRFPTQESGIMRAIKRHKIDPVAEGKELAGKQPLWEQQGYLSLEDMHRTEAAMGNPISIKYLADLKKGLKQFPKETHKFMGRPLKDKDFSEIDRMTMEGKIPDARGRTWNLKAPETGPFQGWTPSVVPKANIPASKINHQMIADKYGIDVELIRGKDWVEVLEIIRKLGYAHGGLARILEV